MEALTQFLGVKFTSHLITLHAWHTMQSHTNVFSIRYSISGDRERLRSNLGTMLGVKLTSLQVTVWQYPSQERSHNELALNVCSFPPCWSRGYLPQLKDTRVVCVFPILLSEIGVSGR